VSCCACESRSRTGRRVWARACAADGLERAQRERRATARVVALAGGPRERSAGGVRLGVGGRWPAGIERARRQVDIMRRDSQFAEFAFLGWIASGRSDVNACATAVGAGRRGASRGGTNALGQLNGYERGAGAEEESTDVSSSAMRTVWSRVLCCRRAATDVWGHAPSAEATKVIVGPGPVMTARSWGRAGVRRHWRRCRMRGCRVQ
jgi:hypothetical protein